MFLLSQPYAYSTSTVASPTIPLKLTGNDRATLDVRVILNRQTAERVALEINLESDRLVFTVENEVENISIVHIGDRVFSLAKDKNNPVEGEFIFDRTSGQVEVITPYYSASQVITYKANRPSTQIKSNCYRGAREQLLYEWNATNSVSMSRSLGSEPSYSFSFVACRDRTEEMLRELGNGTEHVLRSDRVLVESLTIEDIERSNQIKVTVDLSHFLASRGNPSQSAIDKPLRLKQRTGSSYARVRSLSDFARSANVNYSGSNLDIRVPRSTSVTETTTFRELLDSRSLSAKSFVFYNPNGVELKRWDNTPTHIISTAEVKSESIVYNYQGHGTELNGVKLATEYRNLKVQLDFEEDARGENEGVTTEWRFENCNSLSELYSPVEEVGGFLRQPSADILRNPGINFDVGGSLIKKATKTTYLNGTPTFEEQYEAGYAFASSEVYDIEITPQGNITITLNSIANPIDYWGIVKQTTSDWIYDRDGYLERIKITGTRKARLQQESEQLEAVTLKAKSIRDGTEVSGIFTPDPSQEAIAQAYEFTEELPINDTTEYSLGKHRDYYDDVVQPDECQEEDFVEPKFVKLMRRLSEDYIIKDNPKNTEELTYPPIVTGDFKRESEDTTIKSTEFPEKYEVRSRSSTATGEYLKNTRTESNIDYREGKPATHTRLNLEFDFINTTTNFNYETYRNQNYYLSSPGVSNSNLKVNEGTKGYPDIDDPNEVKAIAETELSITNTQNSLTLSLDLIEWRDDIKEGDFVLFKGDRWKVLSINGDRKIIQDKFLVSSFNLTLGLYLEPSLVLENRRNCGSFVSSGNNVAVTILPAENTNLEIPTPNNFWAFENNLFDSIVN